MGIYIAIYSIPFHGCTVPGVFPMRIIGNQHMAKTKLDPKYVFCGSCEMHALCLPFEVAGNSLDLIDGALHRRKLINKNETLFFAGDTFEAFECVSAGSFKLVVPGSPGRVAGFNFAGEMLDAGAMYAGKHGYDAVALEDSYVCTINKESVEEICHQIPDFQGRLIGLMSEQLFHVNRLMTLLTGHRTADESLAAFLTGVSIRFQEHGFPSKEFRLSMARDDVASYLGLAKCTVSRVLARFHQQGLIVSSGKHFEISDIEKLKKLASLPDSFSQRVHH